MGIYQQLRRSQTRQWAHTVGAVLVSVTILTSPTVLAATQAEQTTTNAGVALAQHSVDTGVVLAETVAAHRAVDSANGVVTTASIIPVVEADTIAADGTTILTNDKDNSAAQTNDIETPANVSTYDEVTVIPELEEIIETDTLFVGETETIQGKPGWTRITYRLTTSAVGTIVREKIAETHQPAINRIVKKGTRLRVVEPQRTAEEAIRYGLVYIDDPDLPVGTFQTVREGYDGYARNTYLIGEADNQQLVSAETLRNAQNKVVRRGTKKVVQQVETVAVPYDTVVRAVETLPRGVEQELSAGVLGRATKKQTIYLLHNGTVLRIQEDQEITEMPQAREVARGVGVKTKKVVQETERLAFPTRHESNDQLDPSQSYVSEYGKDGWLQRSVEITYIDGVEDSRNILNEVRQDPKPQVIVRGTRRVEKRTEGRKTPIQFERKEIQDNNLASGSRKEEQRGVVGEQTEFYEVTYVNGVKMEERHLETRITRAPRDEIVRVGTLPGVAIVHGNQRSVYRNSLPATFEQLDQSASPEELERIARDPQSYAYYDYSKEDIRRINALFDQRLYAEKLLELVNAERQRVGAQKLTISNDMMQVALIRSSELAEHGNIRVNNQKHKRVDGRDWATAVNEVAKERRYSMHGENLAQQYPVLNPHQFVSEYYWANTMYQLWYHSKGHYDNMVRKGFTHFGASLSFASDTRDMANAANNGTSAAIGAQIFGAVP